MLELGQKEVMKNVISDGRRYQKKMVEEKQDVMVQVTEEDGRGKEDRRNGEGGGIKCQKKAAKKRRKT